MFSVKSSEIHGVNQYVTLHRESLAHRDDFWRAQGEALVWRTPFSEIFSEDMEKGRFTWFGGGILNPLDSLLGVDPAAKALEVYEGEEQVGEWTFGELFHRAMEFHLFFAANGVKPQDRVALYLPNSLDYVAALFALTAFSATAVPLLVRYPGSFIARVAADCGARLLVLDDSSDDSEYKQRCDVISQLVEQGIVYTGQVEKKSANPGYFSKEMVIPFPSEAPLFLYYHSTGAEKPKGYAFCAGGFPVHTRYSYRFLINEGTRGPGTLVFKGELTSVPGMAYGIWGALLNGDALVVNTQEGTMTMALIDALAARETSTWFMVTPSGFGSMKASLEHTDILMKNRYEKVLLFGDVVSPRMARYLGQNVAASSDRVLTLYMQRQTGVAVIHTLGIEELNHPGSMGVPGLGIRPGVFSDFGSPCALNQSGQLAFGVSWPGMANSIFQQHDRFVQLHFTRLAGHYASGDGVRLDEHGCFWFMKRLDDVFKIDGFSISTTELETLLSSHASVREAAVIGLEGGTNGDRVALFVTPEDARLLSAENDRGEQFRDELRTYLRDHIGEFALPFKIVLMTELPRTRTGKVVRRILHRLALDDVADLGDLSHVANPDSILNHSPSKESGND